jgi:hypothetical protein
MELCGVAAASCSAAPRRPRRAQARAAAAAGTPALALLLCACGAALLRTAAGALAACPVTPAQTLPFVPDAKTLQASCKDSPGGVLACNLPCLCTFGTTLRLAVESVGKSLSGVDKAVLQARARARSSWRLRARHRRKVFPPFPPVASVVFFPPSFLASSPPRALRARAPRARARTPRALCPANHARAPDAGAPLPRSRAPLTISACCMSAD